MDGIKYSYKLQNYMINKKSTLNFDEIFYNKN